MKVDVIYYSAINRKIITIYVLYCHHSIFKLPSPIKVKSA